MEIVQRLQQGAGTGKGDSTGIVICISEGTCTGSGICTSGSIGTCTGTSIGTGAHAQGTN